MDQTLSLGLMQAAARVRRSSYRTLLGVNLVLHIVIGLLALFLPAALASLAGLPRPEPVGWISIWGGMLLLVTVLYLPGWMDPVRVRWPNVVGILGGFLMALIFTVVGLGGGQVARGFLAFALFDLLFAVGLAVLYYRLAIAELMSRP